MGNQQRGSGRKPVLKGDLSDASFQEAHYLISSTLKLSLKLEPPFLTWKEE